MYKNFLNSILILGLTLTSTVYANISDVMTARLISTSGAGVGSILLNESSLLNPASAYFFSNSAVFAQTATLSHNDESSLRTQKYSSGSNSLYGISDTTSSLKGGLSYQIQSENGNDRRRLSSSAAALIGKNTSMGMIYRYTQDEFEGEEENTFHQGVLGITHIYSSNLSIGLRIQDPFVSKKDDDSITAGMQYTLTTKLALIVDYQTRLLKDINKDSSTKAALQVAFTESIFLRYAQEYNSLEKYNATAWGIAWIGPKLSIDYANRTRRYTKDFDLLLKDEVLFESALNLSLVF